MSLLEKLWFPGFVLFLQATMLVMFGVLVEYDEFGAPVEEKADVPDSVGTIRTYYPRTLNKMCSVADVYYVCAHVNLVLSRSDSPCHAIWPSIRLTSMKPLDQHNNSMLGNISLQDEVLHVMGRIM